MREILFRGKETNGNWIEGDLLQYLGAGKVHIAQNYTGAGGREVIPETVGQYTGLTDNNGKKIFEGDICHLVYDWHDWTAEDWYAVVEFGNPNSLYSWGWQLKRISGAANFNKDILLWVEMEDTGATCEVVGNIHDNPELLKGGAE